MRCTTRGDGAIPAVTSRPGENFREAAVRELEEETGLKVDPAHLDSLCVRTFRSETCGEDDEFELFAVGTSVGDDDVVCGEGRQMVFVDPDALGDRQLHQATSLTLDRVLEWSRSHPFVPSADQHRFAGVVLVDREGRILLQERDEHPLIDPGKWGLVGGHVDRGEELEAAAYRELVEETGVQLAPGDLEPFGEFIVDHRGPTTPGTGCRSSSLPPP